jgi:hypothetical protein
MAQVVTRELAAARGLGADPTMTQLEEDQINTPSVAKVDLKAAPGSAQNLYYLVVSDITAARDQFVARGASVTKCSTRGARRAFPARRELARLIRRLHGSGAVRREVAGIKIVFAVTGPNSKQGDLT